MVDMNKLLYFFLIISIFSCDETLNKSSIEKDYHINLNFQNLNNETLLKQLFPDGVHSDTDVVWKPSYEDYFSFKEQISDDGLCHTKVDTIFNLGKSHFVLFETNKFHKGNIEICHPCAPIVGIAEFHKSDSGYLFHQFKKYVFQHGAFGTKGMIEIEKFGETLTLLKVSSNWIGTGSILEFINYYSLDTFNPVYNYTSYESNGGMFEESDPHYDETKKDLILNANGEFQIEIINKEYNESTKLHELRSSRNYLKYNSENESFEEICK